MPKENEPARNLYDSMFQLFFKDDKSRFVDLYEVLSGKRLKEEDIEPYYLKSEAIAKPLNNDVSYLTNDNRLIILVEHQSRPNPNMPQRQFLYYSVLLHEWLTENQKKLSGDVAAEIPMPEFYVAYNGKRPFDPSTLSMKNDFMTVNCKLMDVSLQNIKAAGFDVDKNNALVAYAYFTHEYRAKLEESAAQGIKGKEAAAKAFIHAQEQCIKEGYCPDFFTRRDMMMVLQPLLSREDELRYELKDEFIEQGIEQGRKEAAYNFAKKTNLQTTPKQLADIFEITPEAAEAAYAQAKLDLAKNPLQKLENAKLNITVPKL